MSVEIVHYQHDPVSVGVVLVDQFLYHMRPVHLRATLSDLDSAPSVQRCKQHEQAAHSTFANGTGEASTATCLGDGTCPATGKDGQHTRAVQFDGVDDHVSLPPLGDSFEQYALAFWLNVVSLPTAGNRMYILDTDRTAAGALDIYLNDAGNVVFEVNGAVTQEGGPHTTSFSFAGNLNSWHHFAFNYLKHTIGTGFSAAYVDAANDNPSFDSNFGYDTADEIFVGPGRLGNDIGGDGPYDGLLDEFVFFNDDTLQAHTSIRQSEIKKVHDGEYSFKWELYTKLAKLPLLLLLHVPEGSLLQQFLSQGFRSYLQLG